MVRNSGAVVRHARRPRSPRCSQRCISTSRERDLGVDARAAARPRRAEEGEGRAQRAGADAGHEDEVRRVAALRPAASAARRRTPRSRRRPRSPSRSSSAAAQVGGRPRATSWRSAAARIRAAACWPAASVGKNRSFGTPSTVAALARPRGTAASRVGREQAGRPAAAPPAVRRKRPRREPRGLVVERSDTRCLTASRLAICSIRKASRSAIGAGESPPPGRRCRARAPRACRHGWRR